MIGFIGGFAQRDHGAIDETKEQADEQEDRQSETSGSRREVGLIHAALAGRGGASLDAHGRTGC
jgi:hypothetical protein